MLVPLDLSEINNGNSRSISISFHFSKFIAIAEIRIMFWTTFSSR